ncbi:ubiquitin receptor RAD23d isoform X2 [Raphanus sativus]|uniref:Ubiquitin receptor RAD23 n=1 Tax=Raphanus sativus TaxID=3726 RepID=A0A6J0KBE7_RAPSA|nr:ubiquitin receptor RAD23d isoform X2 [Raphanus sativus]
MKIFVRTLKGARFEIQVEPEDSVADVKKKIETVLGVTAAEQLLIHKGKVLKDETTVEANNVSEKSIIGVMKILQMAGSRALSREEIVNAPYFEFNDIDKALGYISFEELPVQIEDHFKTEDQTHEERETRPSVADLERALDFSRYTEQYEDLRDMAQSNPSIGKDYVERLEQYNPELFRFIRDNKADFLCLLLERGAGGNEVEQPPEELQADKTNKPNNGEGDGGNLVGESKETEVEVATPEDYELIERLEAMGFERGDAEVAYFSCNKNVQEAANHLLGDN